MLEMRPGCECCDAELPAGKPGAMICSFECTFCADSTESVLKGVCPNCGGVLAARPLRTGAALARFPASTKRVVKAEGCA